MKAIIPILILVLSGMASDAGAAPEKPTIDDEMRAAITAATVKNLEEVEVYLAGGDAGGGPAPNFWMPFVNGRSREYERAVRTIVREARFHELQRRNNAALIIHYLSDSIQYRKDEAKAEQYRQWALGWLKSKDLNIRLAGLGEFVGRKRRGEKIGDEADQQTVHAAVLQLLRETDGRYPEVDAALEFLAPRDHAAVRAVYDKRFAGQTWQYDPTDFGYGKRDLPRVEDRGNRQGALVVMLAKTHDARLDAELRRSLQQKDDPNRKAWALVILGVAARTDFNPAMLDALSDKTIVPVEISNHIRDPEAKGPYLQAIVYSRVCDAAARSLYYANEGILNGLSNNRFGFAIPFPGVLKRDGDTVFKHHEKISEPELNKNMRRFERSWVMGFTDEQLKQLHEYYSKKDAPKPAASGTLAPLNDQVIRQAVTAYLDATLSYVARGNGLKPGGYWSYIEPFAGQRPDVQQILRRCDTELVRQLKERNNLDLIAESLDGNFDRRNPEAVTALHPLAMQCLRSAKLEHQRAAVLWSSLHARLLDPGERALARQRALAILRAEKGRDTIWIYLDRLMAVEDVPALRILYEKRFAPQGQPLDYRLTNHPSGFTDMTGRFEGLMVLARVGDRKAHEEILKAIRQTEDIQQRAWGLVMAFETHLVSTLPDIRKALDDQRLVPEMIDEWRDPEAKGPYLGAMVYTRVCDVAVRALVSLWPPPKESNPLSPSLRMHLTWPCWWFGHGRSLRLHDFKQPISEREFNQSKGRFERGWVVGFSPERLDWARNYARQQMETKTPASQPHSATRPAKMDP